MAAVTNTNNLTGLARAMVNHGWLSEDDAEGVWKRASQSGDSFVTELIKGRRFKSDQVAEFAAASFGFPYLDLNAMDHESLPQGLLDPKLVQKRRVVALYQRGNKLYVATSDPTHLQALDEVKFQTGQTVEPVVVEDDNLGKLIEKAGQENDNTMAVLNAEDLNLDFLDEESAAAAQQDTGGIEIDDAPVVRYLQKIMLDAINIGASDIHFEPYEKFYRIRYRRDGILSEIAQPPMAIKDKVASRIKVLSRLDISEKRVPLQSPPANAIRGTNADLPAPLKRWRDPGDDPASGRFIEPPVLISFPPDQSEIDQSDLGGDPLVLKADGGKLPLTWLVDGTPIKSDAHLREVTWQPGSAGFTKLTVIDANGRTDRVSVRLR